MLHGIKEVGHHTQSRHLFREQASVLLPGCAPREPPTVPYHREELLALCLQCCRSIPPVVLWTTDCRFPRCSEKCRTVNSRLVTLLRRRGPASLFCPEPRVLFFFSRLVPLLNNGSHSRSLLLWPFINCSHYPKDSLSSQRSHSRESIPRGGRLDSLIELSAAK